MFFNILERFFGSKNDRELIKIQPVVYQVNELEPRMKALSDHDLGNLTFTFKERLSKGETIEELLPEAFAAIREASWRALKMRHFDVQLVGGYVLHKGNIAEMKTGEGKTLVATLPVYLNALTGKGVHCITVNDYLAKRDTEWMGQIYRFMNLSVGTIVQGMDEMARKEAYGSDITYGTNNEFGFDYLRDNMKFAVKELVQRELHYAIVDEVDSILIDEARTPLIISGPAEQSTHLYSKVNGIIPNFKQDTDYTLDEKARSAVLTEDGVSYAEKLLKVENLYDPKYIELLHHVNQALKAHALFKRDVDYVVKDNEVIIVDEFTGRLMPGRRYSDGLHQALEAKEHVKIENENQTLASITFQNYFRMYDKLSGMTGTADTEAAEFKKIYNLDVLVIPTNKNMVRNDHPDLIYKTQKEKYEAAIDEIEALNKSGQPVLVGTISIDISEDLSKKLKKRGVPHEVLNAKNHKKEAEIISNAGQKGAVTISTNMAGRGTDIVLGDGVHELGGLHVLGTSRHESRRIDNQLRGRSGRQGDPGSSRFYLSLEDDLMRIFGGDRIHSIMDRLGMEAGEPIEHRLISGAIERAQRKVEGHHFDIRKQLIEYDDVMNQQREVIYRQRQEALRGDNLKPAIEEMIQGIIEGIAEEFSDERALPYEWEWELLNDEFYQFFFYRVHPDNNLLDGLSPEGLYEWLYQDVTAVYTRKETDIGAREFRQIEQWITLQAVDRHWKEHLLSMDHLKEGIGLRGYAQQNPLIVYKKEGFEMFQDMIFQIQKEIISALFRVERVRTENLETLAQKEHKQLTYSHGKEPAKKEPVKRAEQKVGRNSPCPCGSGKKFKQCCATK
ncbi:MAG: preprotein translocase subunit SecA [Candidatus Magnetomorum sp.]|nr:preprotein translocase subunit SecA [Candidatus Magnetomorum sp.]